MSEREFHYRWEYELRAEAMEIRDTKAEHGGVTEEDWRGIDELPHGSWRTPRMVVNSER